MVIDTCSKNDDDQVNDWWLVNDWCMYFIILVRSGKNQFSNKHKFSGDGVLPTPARLIVVFTLELSGLCPPHPVISWFINPFNYSILVAISSIKWSHPGTLLNHFFRHYKMENRMFGVVLEWFIRICFLFSFWASITL